MIDSKAVRRALIESAPLGFARKNLAVRLARRDALGVTMVADVMSYDVLDVRDPVFFSRQTDTIFILGSGTSVNELTARDWLEIGRHTSVGLNSWVVHDFLPDFYAFEEMESLAYSSHSATLSRLLGREEILEKRPGVLILRPKLSTEPERIISVPQSLQEQVRLYGRTSVTTRKFSNLQSDLARLVSATDDRDFPASVVIDAGMSVVRMVSLAMRLGYKDAVLVGVDLNSNNYFWDTDVSHLMRRGLQDFNPWYTRGPVHDTEETTNRAFPASKFIPALAKAGLDEHGFTLWVSSPTSKLAGDLPLYPWATGHDWKYGR